MAWLCPARQSVGGSPQTQKSLVSLGGRQASVHLGQGAPCAEGRSVGAHLRLGVPVTPALFPVRGSALVFRWRVLSARRGACLRVRARPPPRRRAVGDSRAGGVGWGGLRPAGPRRRRCPAALLRWPSVNFVSSSTVRSTDLSLAPAPKDASAAALPGTRRAAQRRDTRDLQPRAGAATRGRARDER